MDQSTARLDTVEDWQRDKDSQSRGITKMGGFFEAAILAGAALLGALGYGLVIQPLANSAPQAQATR